MGTIFEGDFELAGRIMHVGSGPARSRREVRKSDVIDFLRAW
jgi:hypothetical protein